MSSSTFRKIGDAAEVAGFAAAPEVGVGMLAVEHGKGLLGGVLIAISIIFIIWLIAAYGAHRSGSTLAILAIFVVLFGIPGLRMVWPKKKSAA